MISHVPPLDKEHERERKKYMDWRRYSSLYTLLMSFTIIIDI